MRPLLVALTALQLQFHCSCVKIEVEAAGIRAEALESDDIDISRLAFSGFTGNFSDLAASLERTLSDTSFITDLCGNQTLFFLNSLKQRWAMQMLDSIGKPGSGNLFGNFHWPGSFDECISVQNDWNDSIPGSLRITGKYCTASTIVNTTAATIPLTVGLCVPDGCTENDTLSWLQSALHLTTHRSIPISVACQDLTRTFDAAAITAICVCAGFALLLLLATTYDMARSADELQDSLLIEENSLRQEMAEAASLNRRDTESSPLIRSGGFRPASGHGRLAEEKHGIRGFLSGLVTCFSLYTNTKILLRTSRQGSCRDQLCPRLGCVNGIRFLTICWIMFGHVYIYSMPTADSLVYMFTTRLSRWSSQVILNASFTTDTFFFLSGVLVMYLLHNEFCSRGGSLGFAKWLHLYIHRYMRLTPAYAAVLMIWSCLAVFFSDGPFWPRTKQFNTMCASNWWTNMAYVNNFWDYTDQCMNWTWYLANEMQFFLVAPLLVWLTYRSRAAGVTVISLLVLASCITSVVLSVKKGLFIDLLGSPLPELVSHGPSSASFFFADDYYVKPWCRFQAYGAGMLLGVLLKTNAGYRHQVSARLPFYHYIGWVIAAVCCITLLYCPHDVEVGLRHISVVEAAVYNGVGRLAWCCAVGWLLFTCCTGQAGWIEKLLSWAPFAALGRLTYCAYLVHPIIIMMSNAASRTYVSLDDLSVANRFVSTLGLSLTASFVISMAFEMPIMAVEKLLVARW